MKNCECFTLQSDGFNREKGTQVSVFDSSSCGGEQRYRTSLVISCVSHGVTEDWRFRVCGRFS
jgi:hypothetical protein